ncbi:MAG: CotH kinase family protein [Acidobacteria bacterium]|nr:CotH kinase family protein [Acidobacteriota bacterium]
MGRTIFLLPVCALFLTAQTADDLFDDRVMHEVRIRINPADWRKLKENYLDNTYYACNFEWRGKQVENVGIRSRGKGSRSGVKPGLRVDFNRFEADQHFLGLKSVQLKNLVQDASMLQDRLGMLVLARAGVPTPRVAHARLFVNGEYAGVYSLTESIDKDFLKRTWGENNGYLYKFEVPPQPWHFDYLGPDPSRYSPVPFEPKTHEKDPDPAPLAAMMRAISLSPDAEFVSAVSEYLDLRRYVIQVAVETFLSDVDGILSPNNFYLYRFERRKRSAFIAWDKDMAFGWPENTIWLQTEENVLMRRCLRVPELRRLFFETLHLAAAITGTHGGWLFQEAARAYEQIRPSVLEDRMKICPNGQNVMASCTNERFEAAVASLARFIELRGEYVDGEAAAAGYTQTDDAPHLSGAGGTNSGAPAVLFGDGFTEGVSVWVNGFRAEVDSISLHEIWFRVPPKAQPGANPVTVIRDGVPSNTVTLEVTEG